MCISRLKWNSRIRCRVYGRKGNNKTADLVLNHVYVCARYFFFLVQHTYARDSASLKGFIDFGLLSYIAGL